MPQTSTRRSPTPTSRPRSRRGCARSRTSACRRSRPARTRPSAQREEVPCRLRTPFQRDRDRIVHSKSFRRLKHKTQVFIAPEGDHYRTRLTHTLEACGISRTVARALRLNEDLTEAIGLGHDLGHPPFGHTGEEALDAALHERFGRRFHHNEQSLRVVERARARRPRASTSPSRCATGSCATPGREPPATLEGRIVRLVDRIAYINHDIDDALRAGVLAEERPARARRSRSSARPAASGSTCSCTTWSSTPSGPATSSRARRSAARWRACASSCSSTSTWARRRAASRSRVAGVIETLFDHYLDAPGASCRRPPARDDDLPTRVTDYLAGMTDRFCIRDFERARRCRGSSRLSRCVDLGESIERVRAGRRHRRGRLGLHGPAPRRAPASPGLCPFHDERTPSFSVDPAEKLYYCFGCQAGGDVFTFLQEKEGLEFREAVEQLADRYGVELAFDADATRGEERAPPRPRAAATSCWRKTAGFYARYLWDSDEAAKARDLPRGPRARPRGARASSASASPRAPGTGC